MSGPYGPSRVGFSIHLFKAILVDTNSCFQRAWVIVY